MDRINLNPFHGIIESDEYPLARFKRVGLGQKIWDTFVVFAGKPPLISEKVQLGIFDYCTLGIPFLLNRWMTNGLNANHHGVWLKRLTLPLVLINIPIFLLRCLSAILLTCLSLPLVGGVHLASYLAGRHERAQIYATQGESFDKPVLLGEALRQRGLGLDDLDIQYRKGSILFKPRLPAPDDYPVMGCIYLDVDEDLEPIMVVKPKLTGSQPYWPAFFALNIANAAGAVTENPAEVAKPV